MKDKIRYHERGRYVVCEYGGFRFGNGDCLSLCLSWVVCAWCWLAWSGLVIVSYHVMAVLRVNSIFGCFFSCAWRGQDGILCGLVEGAGLLGMWALQG